MVMRRPHLKYHHLGIPTNEPRSGETHLPDFGVHVSGYDTSRFRIEWMRYDQGSSVPELVRRVPHVAFEVPSVRRAIRGKKVIIPPNSPSRGVLVAFIEENGAPIEFIQMEKHGSGGTPRRRKRG
jgi:hypothetical protein